MLLPRHVSFELDPATTQIIKREDTTDFEVAMALTALLVYDAGEHVQAALKIFSDCLLLTTCKL